MPTAMKAMILFFLCIRKTQDGKMIISNVANKDEVLPERPRNIEKAVNKKHEIK